MKNYLNNKKGNILVFSYVVVAILLILGGTFVSQAFTEMRTAQVFEKTAKAFQAAEAALTDAYYRVVYFIPPQSIPSSFLALAPDTVAGITQLTQTISTTEITARGITSLGSVTSSAAPQGYINGYVTLTLIDGRGKNAVTTDIVNTKGYRENTYPPQYLDPPPIGCVLTIDGLLIRTDKNNEAGVTPNLTNWRMNPDPKLTTELRFPGEGDNLQRLRHYMDTVENALGDKVMVIQATGEVRIDPAMNIPEDKNVVIVKRSNSARNLNVFIEGTRGLGQRFDRQVTFFTDGDAINRVTNSGSGATEQLLAVIASNIAVGPDDARDKLSEFYVSLNNLWIIAPARRDINAIVVGTTEFLYSGNNQEIDLKPATGLSRGRIIAGVNNVNVQPPSAFRVTGGYSGGGAQGQGNGGGSGGGSSGGSSGGSGGAGDDVSIIFGGSQAQAMPTNFIPNANPDTGTSAWVKGETNWREDAAQEPEDPTGGHNSGPGNSGD